MKQLLKLVTVTLVVISNVITYTEAMNCKITNPRLSNEELACRVVDSAKFNWKNPQDIWGDIVNQLKEYAVTTLGLSNEGGYAIGYATSHALHVMQIFFYQQYPNGNWEDIESILFQGPESSDLEDIAIEECNSEC